MKSICLKRAAHLTGGLISLGAMAFFLLKIGGQWQLIFYRHPRIYEIGFVLFAAVVYGTSQLLLSTAWGKLLRWSGQEEADFRRCHAIYGVSQFAKYIPGNIFHYAGRHGLGREAGFQHTALILASLLETALIIISVTAIATTGAFMNQLELTDIRRVALALSGGLFFSILTIFSLFILVPMLFRWQGIQAPRWSVFNFINDMLGTVIYYITFFLFAGMIFTVLTYLISGIEKISLWQIGRLVTMFTLAWTMGFITPGAPGGLGVREASLVLLLRSVVPEKDALLIAMLFRVITVLGDLFFWGLSMTVFSPFQFFVRRHDEE